MSFQSTMLANATCMLLTCLLSFSLQSAELSEVYKGSDFGVSSDYRPGPVALDNAGNLYFALSNGEIMRTTPNGGVSLFHSPITTGANFLEGINFLTFDHLGNLYLGGSLATDSGFNTGIEAVFKISAFFGAVTELFRHESGSTGIELLAITDGVVDEQGNLFVSGYVSDNVIRIGANGGVTEILNGPSLLGGIPFDNPWDLLFDSAGNLFVAAGGSSNVVKLTPAGEVIEILSQDSIGEGVIFGSPFSVAINQFDELFVSSISPNGGAVVVYPDGHISKAIGESGDGTGVVITYGDFGHVESGLEFSGEPLIGPRRTAVDSAGNFYVVGDYSDNVFRINRDGSVVTLLGSSTHFYPEIRNPQFVVVDANDSVYVSAYGSRNIVRIENDLSGGGGPNDTVDSVTDTFNGFPADATNPIRRFYNTRDNAFFYTSSEAEADMIVARSASTQPAASRWPYVFQGSTYSSAHSYAGSVSLHRFYNFKTGHHFFTASESELEFVMQKIETDGWNFIYEGPAFRVYLEDPTPGFNGKELPVFRFYSPALNRHFFTANQAEAGLLFGTAEWNYEGIGFYGELH